MAKIRPPLFTEAIHISDPSPCIQVLRPRLGCSRGQAVLRGLWWRSRRAEH
jgi:hypothetical protein